MDRLGGGVRTVNRPRHGGERESQRGRGRKRKVVSVRSSQPFSLGFGQQPLLLMEG
ncbi:hypothetical protein KCP71_00010 [Salmonella enterica subsp. enterica]|nr:hypothetical protein KCP71_00010 [Salmonella enterica subsp. enterica]